MALFFFSISALIVILDAIDYYFFVESAVRFISGFVPLTPVLLLGSSARLFLVLASWCRPACEQPARSYDNVGMKAASQTDIQTWLQLRQLPTQRSHQRQLRQRPG